MTVFIRKDIKVLYVHVPKTAGGSILNLFKENNFDVVFCDVSSATLGFNALRTCSPQHYHSDLLQRTLRLDRFTYAFMTVRHPIDRLKSEFLWRVRDRGVDPSDWARRVLTEYPHDPYLLDNHIRPQHEFHLPDVDVFKFENGFGEDWMDTISNRLGIPLINRNVPRKNVANEFCGRTTADVGFDQAALAQIVQFYRQDFVQFEYSH